MCRVAGGNVIIGSVHNSFGATGNLSETVSNSRCGHSPQTFQSRVREMETFDKAKVVEQMHLGCYDCLGVPSGDKS
jgi:hypothetical protein